MIGVVDLKNGLAVHGIAGNRSNYKPVVVAGFASGQGKISGAIDGNPIALVNHYRRWGIRQFYLADLNALTGGVVQRDSIEQLIRRNDHREELRREEWIVDIGLNDRAGRAEYRWINDLSERGDSNIGWVVPSESATSHATISHLKSNVPPQKLVLGIDFREGVFIGPQTHCTADDLNESRPVEAWICSAASAGITAALLLDVSAVGTSRGPAMLGGCRDLRRRHPDWRILSGGGCRSPGDIKMYLDAGCDACLVATALHRPLDDCRE